MNGKFKLAIPSLGPGGMDAVSSTHFGHCDCFTLVDIEDGHVTGSEVLDNSAHQKHGCMALVSQLRQKSVDTLIVGGIGMRPFMAFREAGFRVFSGAVGTVDFIVNEFVEGRLSEAGEEVVCSHSRSGECSGQGHGHTLGHGRE